MRQKILFIFAFNFSFLFIGLLCLSKQSHSQDIQFDWKHIIANGTSEAEGGKSIAIDSVGYVYVGGILTTGTITFLDTTITTTGIYESFVAKLTSAGNMIWFKWFRSQYCRVESICIDRENKLYIEGTYSPSVSFDNTVIHSNNTDSMLVLNMFIAKFDTSGTFLWARNTRGINYFAGSGNGPLKKLAIDSQNNLIVTGRCYNNLQYFDSTAVITVGDPFVGFLAKYTSSGQKLWVKQIGGESCFPYAVKTDNENNILVTGKFENTTFFDSISLSITFNPNMFLAKYKSNGGVMWAYKAGGDAGCSGFDIGIDNNNNVYVVGLMHGNNVEFGGQLIYPWSSGEGFLVKYNKTGSYNWVFPIGTSHININANTDNSAFAVCVKSDTIYVLGSFIDTLTYGNIILQSDGKYETFLMKFNLSGNVLEVGQYLAYMSTYPQQLTLDNSNNIYIIGLQRNNILIGRVQGLFPVIIIEAKTGVLIC